ncbi:hypothetical protein SLU01_02080 [Sporosarcina luteola]|uniref:General stress protein FMN-binding split barrel domain-containing protein n=1 Tax=Sporosarcina luteola TaxID=582850 RepID=A0A511Z397_9BACL|nr:pyridoxamine 5'-phosphate oxidase family protein [Sporosarcina luteola]GEN81896.1 hypothetical protein SLU01_02080 [Sporosarcina luteola]
MLKTESDEGLVSRPLKTQEVNFDFDLCFLTKKETDKHRKILHGKEVNVDYARKSYVFVSGQAKIVEDQTRKRKSGGNPT